MHGIKRLLIVVGVAGCGGGGGGGGGGVTVDASSLIDGQLGGGDAHDGGQTIDSSLQVASNDRCANAIAINLATTHSELTTNTVGAAADLAAPCGTAGTPDVFFKFTLTRREMIYADTFGASSNTTLFLATSCTAALTGSTTAGDAVCSTGACGTGQSQVTALLDPATYYLVLAGQGAATIHFQHAEVGTGSVAYLAQGVSAPTGTTGGFGNLEACTAAGPENAYWWQTCPADLGGTFTASTCTGTNFDTVLSLQMPGSSPDPVCNDDVCSVQSSVSASIPAGAGLFVIDVDSNFSTVHGDYTLSVTRP